MHKSIWRLFWRVVLAALLPLAVGQAKSAPSVLVLARAGTNKPSSTFEVLSFSSAGRKAVAELEGHVWYGTDENLAAFLQLNAPGSAGARLVVIDRKTQAITADKILPGVHPWPLKMIISQRLAVRSQAATVDFDGFLEHTSGFFEVNWKTGAAVRLPGDPLGSPTWLSVPSGVVVSNFKTMAAYDASTHKQVLLLEGGCGSYLQPRQVYYLPTVGLMEYCNGTHRQLTDTNLSTAVVHLKQFSTSEMASSIFVRNMEGQPRLIWGESKEAADSRMRPRAVTEIVSLDPGSGKEVLRKPLEGTFSAGFQPNSAGTAIYFIKPQNGEIFRLDLKTQTISSFAETGLQNFDGWSSVMVAAD
ncbi:MAG: hypothetical protein JWR69_1802 [Pedosphaera sp.]|nr:hypothetical protein [Pedosphaera sp.]